MFYQILLSRTIDLSIQLLGTFCHLRTLYFSPQFFRCFFEINFNNKLCALLSYSATRHGIVEKSSRNVKAEHIMQSCRSRGCPDIGRSVEPILRYISQTGVQIKPTKLLSFPPPPPEFLDPLTALVWQ